MYPPAPLCDCALCAADEPTMYVTPLVTIKAIRSNEDRRRPDRLYCPRCGGRLGITEAVVDSVSYTHFVQPCGACAALWVL